MKSRIDAFVDQRYFRIDKMMKEIKVRALKQNFKIWPTGIPKAHKKKEIKCKRRNGEEMMADNIPKLGKDLKV